MMASENENASFGNFPQMQPRRRLQDPEAAANMPIDYLRGGVAGMLGLPSDTINLIGALRSLGRSDKAKSEMPFGSEYWLENLPLKNDKAANKVAGHVGALLATPSVMSATGKAGKGLAKVVGEELNAAMLGERPGSLLEKLTPQPLYAVEPSSVATPSLRQEVEKAVKNSELMGPTDPLQNFGRKQTEDAARQKKITKTAQAESVQTEKIDTAPRREARPGTYYREMAETDGPEAVLKAAQKGDHIQRKSDGSFIGFPRDITSSQGIGALRNRLDRNVDEGAIAINYADPARPAGSWYPRAKSGMAETSEPWRIGRDVEQHSVYSAGVSPASETDLALKHATSRAIGDPRRAKYQQQADTLDSAVAEERAASLGDKTGEYGPKIDPRQMTAGQFGVNDFRNAQNFGFTDPQGSPWKAGVSPQMHQVMDAETALQVDRLNRKNAGGRTDWSGPMTQEVPWINGKAQDLYSQRAGASYPVGRQGMIQALRDANNTMAESIPKHSFSSTHEQMPGFNTGHMSQLHDFSSAQKDAYSRAVPWALRNNEAKLYGDQTMPAMVGAGNRDVLQSAAQFRTLPNQEHIGRYTNSSGNVENNLSNVSTALVDMTTGKQSVNPNTMKVLEAIENQRGGLDAQEASAGHIVHTAKQIPASQQNAAIIDTGRVPLDAGQIDSMNAKLAALRSDPKEVAKFEKKRSLPGGGEKQWVPTQREFVVDALREGTGLNVSPSSRGALVADFNTAYDQPAVAAESIKLAREAGLPIEPGKLESFYIPHEYGQGKKTSSILQQYADLPEGVSQTVSQNISESPDVRKVIKDQIARDNSPIFGGNAREDLQLMRKFFSEADWSKAVDMIKKGATPAAAVAALGYSLPSMAEEKR
jgi:hypothetical protein